MHTRIKFTRPLPLVISLPDSLHEIWIEFEALTGMWSVATARLGDASERSLTVGMSTRHELELALRDGVELSPDITSQSIVAELVGQDRAQFIDQAA